MVAYLGGQLTWPLTQAAVHGVDAGLSLQAAGRRLGQVAAEAGVAGLPGQPLQGGVGEGRHVLPAPVRHVDLPEPHPGSHHGLVLKTHTHTHRSQNKARSHHRRLSYFSVLNPFNFLIIEKKKNYDTC